MLSLLGWIPVLGPIIQALGNTAASMYAKFKDTALGMRQQEVEEAKVSAQIIHDTNDDICLRFLRDLAILPVVVWSALIGWDTIIAYQPWGKAWMWNVPNYPMSVGYLPYMVMVFLFGNIGLNIWRRK